MTWIKSPLPTDKEWAPPEEGGMYPSNLETGYVMFCMNGHKWWELVSSPARCPACNDYHVSHYKPSPLKWAWHLLREFLNGTPVSTHRAYVKRRLSRGEED